MNATVTHGLADDLFKPVNNAVDELLGDPTAALRASADMTNPADSSVVKAMSAPSNSMNKMLPQLMLAANYIHDGPTNAAVDARFNALPGVKNVG